MQYMICLKVLFVETYKLKAYFTTFSLFRWDFNISVFGMLKVLFIKNIFAFLLCSNNYNNLLIVKACKIAPLKRTPKI